MNKSKTGNIILLVGGAALVLGVGTYLYQQYALTDMLCYGTKGFKFKKIGLASTTVELNLAIENKGELAIGLKKMIMDVYANGTFVAKINQDISTSITPFGTTLLPVNITFNPKQVVGSVFNILTASAFKDITFRFDGRVVVKKFGLPIPIPFDFNYTVSEMTKSEGTSVCDDKNKTT